MSQPAPSATLLVSRTSGEVRVAVVEDGAATAFYFERDGERGIVGNIYMGKVVRVVPGMQAAFVDVGLDRAGFLYVGDVLLEDDPAGKSPSDPGSSGESTQVPLPGDEPDDAAAEIPEEPTVIENSVLLAAEPGSDEESEAGRHQDFEPRPPEAGADPRDPETTLRPLSATSSRPSRADRPPIETLLEPGQSVLVQVSKEPLGTKGARLTMQIALPGRFLVYLPSSRHVGVSRRIDDLEERERLRSLVDSARSQSEGFIVRTVCEGAGEEALSGDMDYLREVWSEVQARAASRGVPAEVHAELDLVLRSGRDMLTAEIEQVLVDDRGDWERLDEFTGRFMVGSRDKLVFYEEDKPLFDSLGVERQLARALGRRVRLPSGGYIVIDHSEALTAIDVNSGRFTRGRDLAETSLAVNLEASRVIVEQLRLRDIGGLIVIDYIDMESLESRARVEDELAELLERDSARSSVLPISEFGLVQMTRRRVREDLARRLQAPCQACGGVGRIKSTETVSYEVLRQLSQEVSAARGTGRTLVAHCGSIVADHLQRHEQPFIEVLTEALGGELRIVEEEHFHPERFRVAFEKQGRVES